jgi:hypothetical protein
MVTIGVVVVVAVVAVVVVVGAEPTNEAVGRLEVEMAIGLVDRCADPLRPRRGDLDVDNLLEVGDVGVDIGGDGEVVGGDDDVDIGDDGVGCEAVAAAVARMADEMGSADVE